MVASSIFRRSRPNTHGRLTLLSSSFLETSDECTSGDRRRSEDLLRSNHINEISIIDDAYLTVPTRAVLG